DGDVLAARLDHAGRRDAILVWRSRRILGRRRMRHGLRFAVHVVETQAAHRQGHERQNNSTHGILHSSPPVTIRPSLISTMRSPTHNPRLSGVTTMPARPG